MQDQRSSEGSLLKHPGADTNHAQRVFDCFTFHNEVDLLRLRVNLLQGIVDVFVVAEATKTFSGLDRTPLLTEQFLAALGAPVEVVLVDDFDDFVDTDDPCEEAWQRERHQRRCLVRGLEAAGADEGDVVIVTDVDEIPDPEIIRRVRTTGLASPHELTMAFHQYRLNLVVPLPWPLARISPFFRDIDPQALRVAEDLPKIEHAGWHLTYLGDAETAAVKLASFAHRELEGTFDSRVHLDRCIRLNVDLLGRFELHALPPGNLPEPLVDHFRGSPEMLAPMPQWKNRLQARVYRTLTRQRMRLGPQRCDEHPVAMAAVAVALRAASSVRALLPLGSRRTTGAS